MADQHNLMLEQLVHAVGEGTLTDLRSSVRNLDDVEVARLLEAVPADARKVIWSLLDEDTSAQALQYLADDIQADILAEMDAEEIAAFSSALETDDFADIIQQLPDAIVQQVLAALDAQERERVEAVLGFPEDSAGGLMNTDTITVRARHSIGLVQRYLRRFESLPQDTDALVVVNSRGEYVGLLPLTRLLTCSPELTVREIMSTAVEPFLATASEDEVAERFAREDLVSAPVVDDAGRLLGRITVDDVLDVIVETAEEQFMGRVGLDESADTFGPIIRASRRRAVWLGINLLTAIAAATVISLFEATIAEVVALAVLMPIVPSMGGIAATQTLTLTVRGMAVGHVVAANLGLLLNRELLISFLNGIVWSSLIALGATLWFGDPTLGMVVAIAVVVNMFIGAASGATLPLVLDWFGIDPAIAGGVIVTTITDVVGFFVFLGLAALFYAS